MDEGKIYNEIVKVEATDRDCTPKFGDVCKYEILTSDQPFVIDMDGVIRWINICLHVIFDHDDTILNWYSPKNCFTSLL